MRALHLIREAKLDPPPHFEIMQVYCPACGEPVWIYHHQEEEVVE